MSLRSLSEYHQGGSPSREPQEWQGGPIVKPPTQRQYYLEGLSVPETPAPGKEPGPWKKTRVIGRPLPRVDAYERVSGSAVYPSDVSFPDALYGAILRCPHPSAVVTGVDSEAAEQMPGVAAVISAFSNTPNPTWPYLLGSKSRIFDIRCRFERRARGSRRGRYAIPSMGHRHGP